MVERAQLRRLLATVAAAERAMSPEEREHVLWPGLAELVDFNEPAVLALVRPYLTEPRRPDPFRLSARERQVLALVAEGCTDRAIGHRLDVSVRTIQKHLEHAYAKLGVNDRTSAALRFVGGRQDPAVGGLSRAQHRTRPAVGVPRHERGTPSSGAGRP